MKGFWSVYRKELYSLFASPIFYVVAFIFLVISGYFFYSIVAYYNVLSYQASQNPMMARQFNILEMIFRPFFLDLSVVLLLIAPLLTMRLFAEERKAGTLELLFTYPISDWAMVLAKFKAVMSAFGIILLGTLPGVLFVSVLGSPSWKPVACAYLGVFLLGGSFISLGVFTSSLTQNQIIAAVLSFGGLLLLWVIGWLKNVVESPIGEVADYLSFAKHFDSFAKGVLDSRDLLFYILFTVFFLFLTLRQMGSYRWRG
ncbi:MAG TPA: ABC transporter permease subunit [Syntrophobacter fumaroxidans]|nr:ABC transporter permease subunit [Syntrophobacter fumaroxidans]